jgi:competence protein ComEA
VSLTNQLIHASFIFTDLREGWLTQVWFFAHSCQGEPVQAGLTRKGNAMRNPKKTILTLCLCAAAAFATPCFAQAVQPAVPNKASPAPTAKPTAPKPAATSAPAQLIDINTASEKELSALKGIGDVRAANIVKNRPYKGKDELVQKKIIPPAVYAAIKDKIIAKQQ